MFWSVPVPVLAVTKAFEVTEVVVRTILVDVVDFIALRDRPMHSLPDQPVLVRGTPFPVALLFADVGHDVALAIN